MELTKRMLPVKYLICILSFFLLLILPGGMQVQASDFSFAPEDSSKHVYSFDDSNVEIRLSCSDYGFEDYQKIFDQVVFESSDQDVATVTTHEYSTDYMSCLVTFVKEGFITITAKLDGNILGSFEITVKPGMLKLIPQGSTLVYDSSIPWECGALWFNHALKSATSSDNSVCRAGLTSYSDYYSYYQNKGTESTGEDGKCVIYPMKAGTATITVTDFYGNEFKQKIVVQKSWINSYLNSSENGTFLYYYYEHPDDTEIEPSFEKNLRYGRTNLMIAARYGTKVTLKVGKKTYKTVTANHYGIARIKKVSPAKLGTKVTITCTLDGVTVKKTGKVISEAKIYPNKIKAKSKKGSVDFWELHKGDVLKVTINKKVVKKQTMKRDASRYTLKFTSKSKLKKNQVIKYEVYNKFNQRLAKETYDVGTEPWG